MKRITLFGLSVAALIFIAVFPVRTQQQMPAAFEARNQAIRMAIEWFDQDLKK
jgi:hypothetical protein